MKEVILVLTAKKVLVEEYGEQAVIIDKELNELAKLVIKRKDVIKALNRGNYRSKEQYIEVDKAIKKIIKKINKKLDV